MNIAESIYMGLDQVRVHKMRAALSILGILISVGSVTGIVSMGDGLKITVLKQFEKSGGSNIVKVEPPEQWYRNSKNRWVRRDWEEYLTNRDLTYIENEIKNVKYIVPLISLNSTAGFRGASISANIIASNEHYPETQNWELVSGRFLNERDVRDALKVVVIDTDVKKDLYGDIDPVGKEMRSDSRARYTVVGVFSSKNLFDNGNSRSILVPVTTVQIRENGNTRINQISVMADSPENAGIIAAQLKIVMKRLHTHGDEFQVKTGEGEIGRFNRVVMILKIVAGGIAGISLLVGGIGIMNIMLVSVTERTREIGVRMALGATKSEIMWQFIIEAIVMCVLGGLLGVLLGIGIGAGISVYIKHLTKMPFESIVTPGLIMFALIYSCAVGLFFGVYPAYRASKLDPIEALRYE